MTPPCDPATRPPRHHRRVTPPRRRSSSVTLKVLGTARNAGLVVVSALALGEEISPLQACGYTVSLVAFAMYNYYKINQL